MADYGGLTFSELEIELLQELRSGEVYTGVGLIGKTNLQSLVKRSVRETSDLF